MSESRTSLLDFMSWFEQALAVQTPADGITVIAAVPEGTIYRIRCGHDDALSARGHEGATRKPHAFVMHQRYWQHDRSELTITDAQGVAV